MRFYKPTIMALASILCCFRGAKAQTPPSVGGASNAPTGVPDYVIKYAPLVYLHPQEPYLPSDMTAQLTNTIPKQQYTTLSSGVPSPLTLENLDQLNNLGNKGTDIYLTSKDDITKNPTWLNGVKPDANGKTNDAQSCAVIVVDKGNGEVDAFYMYFYAYNWGGIVLEQNLGNHVGDWEHNMVRFVNGVPSAVWYSQHSAGQAFEYSVVNKDKAGLRPISFSANGSHANYAIPGIHEHTLASIDLPINGPEKGLINDFTDYGPLWDPIKNAYWYSWSPPAPSPPNPATPPLPPTRNGTALGYLTAYDPATSPIGWFYFTGRWGDYQYATSDPRQSELKIFGIPVNGVLKFETGPDGPANKNLQRNNVWPGGVGVLLTELEP